MIDPPPFSLNTSPPGICLEVATQTQAPDIDTQALQRDLARVVQQLDLRRVELNVVIVNDQHMSDLHHRFSGVEGTTDVLTFDLAPKPGACSAAPATESPRDLPAHDAVDGEIYICLDEARRRAADLNHPVQHELLLYATHGLLHLLGYDDHDPDQHRIMHEKEDQLLSAIGVGPVFFREGGLDQ